MHTHVGKWGASCAIRLPKMVVESLGLREGQAVSLAIEGNKLVLQKEVPHYSLKKLVAQMHENNEPELMLNDRPQGEEIL